ncbi:hypothetical protein TcCL_ESM01874 [Trypanosoma cruzi]|nr:hypothetical protein TcCL_ESM01874 [Trypanosoma cruzi]
MPAVSVLAHRALVAALRRRHNPPLHDESNVFFFFLAMNGLLVMLFGSFCWITSPQMVARDVRQQGLSAGLFFSDGRCLGITGACRCHRRCEGRYFSCPKRGCWEDEFHSCS